MHKRNKGFRTGWGPIRGSLAVVFWAFLVALGVTLLSTSLIELLNPFAAAMMLVLIVALGVLFDIIGLAAAASSETPFHALAAKKGFAATRALSIVRNAEFVSSVCNDLVGDVCGTVSGAAALAIVFRLAVLRPSLDPDWLSVVTVSAVAAITVGGKAAGKGYALDKANSIVLRVAEVLTSLQILPGRIAGVFRRFGPRSSGGRRRPAKEAGPRGSGSRK